MKTPFILMAIAATAIFSGLLISLISGTAHAYATGAIIAGILCVVVLLISFAPTKRIHL